MDFFAYSLFSLILLLLLLRNARLISRHFRDVRGGSWIFLGSLLLIFVLVCWFLVPNTHRTFGDEPNELSKIKALEQKSFGLTIQTYLYYLIYTYIEPSNILLIKMNILLAAFCLLTLFLLVRLMFRDDAIALIAAIALGISEPFIVESTTAYTPIISLLLGLLACLCFWLFLVSERISLLMASLIATCFSVVCRIEYILLYPLFFTFLCITFFVSKKRRWLVAGTHISVFLVTIMILFSVFIWENIFNKQRLWEHEQGWGIEYFWHTFFDPFIFYGLPFILLFPFFLFLSLFWIREQRRFLECFFLLAGLALFTTFYVFNIYFAPRFLIALIAFGSFLVGISGRVLLDRLKGIPQQVLAVLFSVLVLFSLQQTLISANRWADENSFAYLSTMAPAIVDQRIDQSCLIVAPYAPNLAMAYDLKVMDAQLATDTQDIFKNNECIYFFEDYLCEYSEEHTGMKYECDAFKQAFQLVPELVISDKRGREYVLYHVYDKSVQNPMHPSVEYVYPLTGMPAIISKLPNARDAAPYR